MGLWKKDGPGVPTALRAAERISTLFALPVDFLQPATGAALIVISRNTWNPFVAHNRWLLAGIILYALMFGLAEAVVAPAGRKAVRLAEAGDYGAEYGRSIRAVERTGPFLGLLLMTILILMIVKPGSGFVHP
jgi:hypothetical protein